MTKQNEFLLFTNASMFMLALCVLPLLQSRFCVENMTGDPDRADGARGRNFVYTFATRTSELFSFRPSMIAPRPAMFWR
jgi:hypothetical protein